MVRGIISAIQSYFHRSFLRVVIGSLDRQSKRIEKVTGSDEFMEYYDERESYNDGFLNTLTRKLCTPTVHMYTDIVDWHDCMNGIGVSDLPFVLSQINEMVFPGRAVVRTRCTMGERRGPTS